MHSKSINSGRKRQHRERRDTYVNSSVVAHFRERMDTGAIIGIIIDKHGAKLKAK